jgi:putative exporter of polyketide antibiotics
MLNLLSFVVGLIAAVVAFVGLIPVLGWLNWLMLPIAFVGVVLGALSSSNGGRNFNLIVMAIGIIRLWLGGGIL